MEFIVDEVDSLNIQDSTMTELLNDVYVVENYVEPGVAKKLFETTSIKDRGVILCAIEKQSRTLAGSVIFVPSNSPACKLAKKNESEMQLLCVRPEYRNKGLGTLLVNSVLNIAKQKGSNKMILWTQRSMKSAQKLYLKSGFVHIENITKNHIEFLVYEKKIIK